MKTNNRLNYQGKHILTNDYFADTDTWMSGLNNNVLIYGPTGAGKTRHYVKPNLLTSHESMVISDTKGILYKQIGPYLQEKGYVVENINFTDLSAGIGYNPMDYIRYDAINGHYCEKDILSLSRCLVDSWSSKDPYWDHAARQYASCLISYVLEALPEEEHTLESVVKLIDKIGTADFNILMDELEVFHPECTAVMKYKSFRNNFKADKMDASIKGILSTNLETLVFDEALALYKKKGRIDFKMLGRKKTALFLTISDTDRSMDKLANAFMTQAIQDLCRSADEDYPEHMLPVPVRFYLDDFATNLYIPDFDKIISVIRSREISVSIILQSITQLDTLYDKPAARTIINNCDRQLYLGGQDPDTAEYISLRVNKPISTILSMPLTDAYLLVRGEKPRLSQKYDLQKLDLERHSSVTNGSSADLAPAAGNDEKVCSGR